MFEMVSETIDVAALRERVLDPAAGGFCSFEGWVRNHHEGRNVKALEYEAYALLAEKEGRRIVDAAIRRFEIRHAVCVHRVGRLEIGEMAVCVCVSAAHRDAAFDACRWIIDEVKGRVPIWKKEFYLDGTSGWVRCDQCVSHTH